MPQDLVKHQYFDVGNLMLKEISQGCLDVKKMARSIENAAEAFIPLTTDAEVTRLLNVISDAGRDAAAATSAIYKMIARDAANG